AGATISLNDRYYNPGDDEGERLAIFHLPITPDGALMNGPTLDAGRWYTLELSWDADDAACTVDLDGERVTTLPMQQQPNADINYLRLRSIAAAADPAGLLIDHVKV